MTRLFRPVAVCGIAFCLLAYGSAKDQSVSLVELVSKAIDSSRLNRSGTPPFHLKASVKDPNTRNSPDAAQIEEDWVAPDKWRRTIKTPDFSQDLIVNGDKVSEVITGDYYPFWLRYAVTAVFDLVPQDFVPRDLPVKAAGNSPAGAFGTNRVISADCQRWLDQVGIAPAQNSVFNTVCFANQKQLSALSTPYFNAFYDEYERFGQMEIARLIKINLEPGVVREVKITQLNELRHPNEDWFTIDATAPQKSLTYSMRIREGDARALLLDPTDIVWAPVNGGKTKGALSIVIYVDRNGNVRETRPLNSDNPDAQEQARKVVAGWRFKPFERNGTPIQMETLLTFAFDTTAGQEATLLTNDQARKLALSKPEFSISHPKFPKGTEYAVRIEVSERGTITGIENINHLDPQLFAAAQAALAMWYFQPYKPDGKPQRFTADIVFQVK